MSDYRTVGFAEIDSETEEEGEAKPRIPTTVIAIEGVIEEEDDIEGEDHELANEEGGKEEGPTALRRLQPPSSLKLDQKATDGNDAFGGGGHGQCRKQSKAQPGDLDFVFNLDLNDKPEEAGESPYNDYSFFENRTGLAEDMVRDRQPQ